MRVIPLTNMGISRGANSSRSGVLAALVLVAGCAPTRDSVHHPEDVHLTPAEHTKLLASAQRTRSLENEIAALKLSFKGMSKRLEVTEMRAGLKPVVTARLNEGRRGERIRLVDDLNRMEAQGERPRKVRLRSHLAGFDGYVVSFWATWCVPCCKPKELAHVRDLRQKLRRHNVEVLSVAVDDLDAVLSDARANTWIYPLWQGKGAHLSMLPRGLVERSGVSLPLFLLVNRNGRILSFVNHELDAETVRDMVTTMANGT